jgi:hypothetical protein
LSNDTLVSRVTSKVRHMSHTSDEARARQCGEQRPIGRPEPGPGELPAQHRHLVAEHEQLDLIGGLAPSAQHDQLQEATQHPVAQGHDHPPILPDASSGERAPRTSNANRIVGTHRLAKLD